MVVLDDPDVGLDYSRVVHGEQRFTHHRPIRAGDRLVATTTIDAARSVAGNDLLTARVDLATEDGEPVCTATSMLVAAAARRDRLQSPTSPSAPSCPSRSSAVTRADLVRYAGASGDFNPIHWNERVATAVGLPGVIAHGMFTMALAGRVVTDWAGDPGALVEYHVRFSRPVVVPDDDAGAEVTVRGKVAALLDDGRVRVDLTVTSDGEKVLSLARATVAPGMTRRGGRLLAAAAALLLAGCTSFADTVSAAGAAAPGAAERRADGGRLPGRSAPRPTRPARSWPRLPPRRRPAPP